jgi:hypothetical protein
VLFTTENSDDLKTFENVASLSESVLFAHTTLADIRVTHNVATEGTHVVVFKSFDEKRNTLAAPFTVDSLNEFVNTVSVPTLLPFNEKAIPLIFQ